MTDQTQDLTLDEIRALLASILPRHAAFDGWRPEAVAMAAAEKNIDADIAALAFDGGAMGMIEAWFASIDARMLEAFPPEKLATMSIRKKISALIETRLALLARQIPQAQADVLTAAAAVRRYFDEEAAPTRHMLKALAQMQSEMTSTDVPRPSETLAALATAAGGR